MDPASADPAATDPASADPAATDPATADPAATDPATADPATNDPVVIDGVRVDPRFSGPAGTGNGGYCSGLVAVPLARPAEATLRRPVPLDVLVERRRDGDRVELVLDGEVLAEAAPATVEVDPPAPVSLEEARAARVGFPMRDHHPFPVCFTCGTGRDEGDGLRIHPGPLGDGRFASDWTPDASLDDGTGNVAPEFVWAALDCPTAIPAIAIIGGNPAVLGRLALRQDAPVRVGEPHVIVSRLVGHEGRKRYGEAALYTTDGDLLAVSSATWIELREPPPSG
jgi:hypothetical protein